MFVDLLTYGYSTKSSDTVRILLLCVFATDPVLSAPLFLRVSVSSFKAAVQFNRNEAEIGGGMAVTGGKVT